MEPQLSCSRLSASILPILYQLRFWCEQYVNQTQSKSRYIPVHKHTHTHTYTHTSTSIHPHTKSTDKGLAGRSTGATHGTPGACHLPVKVGQNGTPTACSLIPCMAVWGSRGTASSFSQEYVGVGMPSSEPHISMMSLPTSSAPWIRQVGMEGGTWEGGGEKEAERKKENRERKRGSAILISQDLRTYFFLFSI